MTFLEADEETRYFRSRWHMSTGFWDQGVSHKAPCPNISSVELVIFDTRKIHGSCP